MPRRLLSLALGVDALLSVGFGLASLLFPGATYGTIVDLTGVSEGSLMAATMSSLSTFYVVVGAVCLVAAFMPAPHNAWIAVVMTARHAWVGIRGFLDIDRVWIVGDPWPDIVIHTLFVVAYTLLVLWQKRSS